MKPWKDGDGTERYACVFRPPPGAGKSPRPLVIYLHPALFGPITLRFTKLLHSQKTHHFIVLAPIGRRTTHFYPFPDNYGLGWDVWYRQLSPAGDITVGGIRYRENVDAATIDHFVAEEISSGEADPHRVYMTGWSNGGAMAYLYALNRQPIAAAAAYSAPNPFGAFDDRCPQRPVFRSPADDREIRIFNRNVQMMDVHPNCDAAGICPNNERLVAQLRVNGVNVQDVILDWLGREANACNRLCGMSPNGDANLLTNVPGWTVGLGNHLLWPTDKTRSMVDFFDSHPAVAK